MNHDAGYGSDDKLDDIATNDRKTIDARTLPNGSNLLHRITDDPQQEYLAHFQQHDAKNVNEYANDYEMGHRIIGSKHKRTNNSSGKEEMMAAGASSLSEMKD